MRHRSMGISTERKGVRQGSSMNRARPFSSLRVAFLLVFTFALAAFSSAPLHAQSASKLYKQGQVAEAQENWDAAFDAYKKAFARKPNDLR